MSKRKYQQGQLVNDIQCFEKMLADGHTLFYHEGWTKPTHYSIFMSQQYRVLKSWFERGLIRLAILNENKE